MTRQKRKPEEDSMIKVFLKHLLSIDINPIVDESVPDKPDLVFEIDSERIGCELTTLTLQDYEKWYRKKGGNNELRKLELKNEPELWLIDSIKSKNTKIDTYKTLRSLNHVWLLVHVGNLPAFGNDEETLHRLKWAAQEAKGNFTEIWFIGEKNLVEKLWDTKQTEIIPEPPPPKHDLISHRAVTIKLERGNNAIDLGEFPPEFRNDDANSHFIRAAYENDLNAVKDHIKNGIDINITDKLGFTAFRYSSGAGHADMVKELIYHGASTNIIYKNGPLSLIELCERRNHHKVVEILKVASTPFTSMIDKNMITGLLIRQLHISSNPISESLFKNQITDTLFPYMDSFFNQLGNASYKSTGKRFPYHKRYKPNQFIYMNLRKSTFKYMSTTGRHTNKKIVRSLSRKLTSDLAQILSEYP